MAKEWILNQSMNRWGLNKKRSVGPVSELIRECSPKNLQEWESFYYKNVYSKDYLGELGRKLYTKITEVIQFEVSEVTEKDCMDYIKELVINRTFEGYQTEIQTIYGHLQNILNISITPAPDKWDRLYNVDFYIVVKDKHIGIQIKPVTFDHTIEDYKWKKVQKDSHDKFQKKYGGKVFTIYSIKSNGKKVIKNTEIIDAIRNEILILGK